MRIFLSACILTAVFSLVKAQPVETVIQKSSEGNCNLMSISSDGFLLAKVKSEGFTGSEIEIWNTKTGHFMRTIETAPENNFSQKIIKALANVHFWRGSKYIVTGTIDGIHEVFDVQTGKKIRKLGRASFTGGVCAVSEKTGTFVALDFLSFAKNQLFFYDLFTNIVYDSAQINVGSISALEFSPDGKSIAVGTEEGGFHIIELATFNRTQKVENAFKKPVRYLQWTSDNYLLTTDDSLYMLWNLNNGQLASNGYLPTGMRIVTSPTEDCFYIADNTGIKKENGQGVLQKTFGVQPDNICKINCDMTGENLYVLSESYARVIDLKNIAQTKNVKTISLRDDELSKEQCALWYNNFCFIPAVKACAYPRKKGVTISGLDTNLKEKNWDINPIHLTSLCAVNESKYIYSETGIFHSGISKTETGKNSFISSSRDENLLFAFPGGEKCVTINAEKNNQDTVLHIYDFTENKIAGVPLSGKINCGNYSADNARFAVGGAKLYLFDAKTLKYKQLYDKVKDQFKFESWGMPVNISMQEDFTNLCFSADGKKIFAASSYGHIKVWNLVTEKIDTLLFIRAKSMAVSADGKRLFVASGNEVVIYNLKNFSPEARIIFLAKGDFIVSLPDNYYKATKNGAKAVAFRKGLQTFGFDQFDLVYNRPDIVVQRIGKPTTQMLEALKKAEKKRLKKMGFTDVSINTAELNAPETHIVDYKNLPTITTEQIVSFKIDVSDKLFSLSRVYIYANGVPTGSAHGNYVKSIPGAENAKQLSVNCSVGLEEGKNVIEVFSMNDKGIESLRESFEIFYSPVKEVKPDLYIIGIGAGSYEDSLFNLKYPVKDIKDIGIFFKTQTDIYNKINIIELTDKDVTRENVLALKKMLLKTYNIDHVMIFWSGHGVLSSDLDYYLATYNMNFSKPQINGLEYAELENLLDSIPARKKVMFIDACHSGELDKEEVALVKTEHQESGNVTFRGVAGISVKQIGLENSFEFMNELFSDVKRGTGANIISSAGGAEYAMEGEAWKNGVFTYSLLEGLKNKKADTNHDGQIMLSELQEYLQQQVFELTNGKQKPTSRVENLCNDCRIW